MSVAAAAAAATTTTTTIKLLSPKQVDIGWS